MNAPERIWAKGNTIDYDLTRWSTSRWNGDTEYIRADLVPQWQPIDTAPKDGTAVLVGCSYFRHGKSQVTLAWHERGMWAEGMYWDEGEEKMVVAQCEFRPTHWMPLPTPPQPTARHST